MTTSLSAARAKAMRTARSSATPAIHPGVLAERERATQLFQLGQQAERMGIQFDAQAAVLSGMAVQAARARVLGEAANADADTHTSTVHTPAMGNDTTTGDGHRAAWKRGFGAPRR